MKERSVVIYRRWEARVDDVVTVPYRLSDSYDAAETRRIKYALQDLADRSGVVQFVARTTENDYISVISSQFSAQQDGCYSYVGRYGGEQRLRLEIPGCLVTDTVQNEFLHALGFWHEQGRSDRDEYITINKENIKPEFAHNFEPRLEGQSLGSEYDYGSVMHYGAKSFTSNGKDTISAPDGVTFGEALEADDEDILQVRLLYQCVSGPRNKVAAEATPCSADCKCWERAEGC